MTRFPASTANEQTNHAALEPSKNSWLLALQSPGRARCPSATGYRCASRGGAPRGRQTVLADLSGQRRSSAALFGGAVRRRCQPPA